MDTYIKVAALVAALLGVGTLSATPALATSYAECGGSARGRLLSTTPLVELNSAAVAAELRDVGLPDEARYGIETYRVVYCTVSPSGAMTAASGLLVLPQSQQAVLQLVVYEHSTAAAKRDAPSFLGETDSRLVPFFFASDGFAVLAPDYLGMGVSPGSHPYLHAATEASATLDLLRAGR